MTNDTETLLELKNVSKNFGGVQALKNVDFSLRKGEIHALVGENGAGKSTLMKIIASVHTGSAGTMTLDGKEVQFNSAREALDHGIGMVHQELSVVQDLTIAENVFLGSQPITRFGMIDWKAMMNGAKELLAGLGLEDLNPRGRLGDLPVGLQQLVELARVLFSGARIIILDEPTSALSPPEIKQLFAVLARLKKEEGRSFVFISHFLEDVLEISDRVTVFRNGELVKTANANEIDKSWIIRQMIGRGHENLEDIYTGNIALESVPEDQPILSVKNLTSKPHFEDISFDVLPGEVLGIYGFMGCGQLELARALFGHLKPTSGEIFIDGKKQNFKDTSHAKRNGIAFVPESRRMMLFAEQPIYRNMSVSILEYINKTWLNPKKEQEIARGHMEALGVKAASEHANLRTLSGGNQQKVGLGRWMTELPRLLILCEPTRGMDVGAKEDVVKIINGLRKKGIGIIVISTEPETVLSMANRIVVMRKGQTVGAFADCSIKKDDLLESA